MNIAELNQNEMMELDGGRKRKRNYGPSVRRRRKLIKRATNNYDLRIGRWSSKKQFNSMIKGATTGALAGSAGGPKGSILGALGGTVTGAAGYLWDSLFG